MRLTGARGAIIKPRNESSSGHDAAQYYYRTRTGSDAPQAALKGSLGERPDMALHGPFLLPAHDPEKWEPGLGKDHAPSKRLTSGIGKDEVEG